MSSAQGSPEPALESADLTSALVARLSGRERSFGRYEMKGEIARGGMGAILKIWDEDLHRHLAMKVILGQGESRLESSKLARFLEEAQVTGQLDHPGIVPVHELGLDPEGRVYFTMKLVKGSSLKEVFDLVAQGKEGWTQTKALGVLLKVCEAMAYAHDKGVIHRDLKPANVMVGKFGEVYVMDWGLARILDRKDEKNIRIREQAPALSTELRSERDEQRDETPDSPLCTMDGDVVGTPAYMPPEQAAGLVDEVGPHSDVYALGAMLYHLLAGHMPYVPKGARLNNYAVWNRVQEGPPRPIAELAGRTPAELVAICDKAMAREHKQRYADMSQLAADLSAYLEHRVVGAYATGVVAEVKKWVERNRPLAAALAGGVLVLVAGLLTSLSLRRQAELKAAQVRSAVESACSESIGFTRAHQLADALEAARRAQALAEAGGADADLLERARSRATQAKEDVDAAERARVLQTADETLHKRIQQLSRQLFAAVEYPDHMRELDAQLTKAFQEYGIDLESDDLVPAATRIRERAIAGEVALLLDDWSWLLRRANPEHREKSDNLFYLAMDLDAEPVHMRLRQAIFDNDLKVLLELAAPEDLQQLTPGMIKVLNRALWFGYPEHHADALRMYDRARHLYPGDFSLQSIGGNMYEIVGRDIDALLCRTAALCLAPNDSLARSKVQDSLLLLGRLTDAESAAKSWVASLPDDPQAYYYLALAEAPLGDLAGALASLQRTLELHDEPERHPDLLALRFRNGAASKDELALALAAEPAPDNLAVCMYALLDHPDPALRDPELVLRTIRATPGRFANSEWLHVVETVANVRIGNWEAALAALGKHGDATTAKLLTPGAFHFLCSLIYSHVGRLDEARASFALGVAGWDALTRADPAAWERSDVLRWRREAEAALPK